MSANLSLACALMSVVAMSVFAVIGLVGWSITFGLIGLANAVALFLRIEAER